MTTLFEWCVVNDDFTLINELQSYISPEKITIGSGKILKWHCNCGNDWECSLRERIKGRSCPICKENSRPRITDERLIKEWSPKNQFPIDELTPHSSKEVWWICSKGHEWMATVNHRSKGTGCPYCSHNALSKEDSLGKCRPELAKEWNYTLNGTLTPFDVSQCSNKKVWWVCKYEHQWQATINNRVHGKGCPFCYRKELMPVSEKRPNYWDGKRRNVPKIGINDLESVCPELAKEWHPIKNGDLKPSDFVSWTDRKVWWKCSRGHEWEASIHNRRRGSNCPYCAGQKVSKENSLAILYPDIANEWDYEKNKKGPNEFSKASKTKVWWKCNEGHSWCTSVQNRTLRGSGCPECYKLKIKLDELLK